MKGQCEDFERHRKTSELLDRSNKDKDSTNMFCIHTHTLVVSLSVLQLAVREVNKEEFTLVSQQNEPEAKTLLCYWMQNVELQCTLTHTAQV